jgi:5'-methylthioadenosine phosphorylase
VDVATVLRTLAANSANARSLIAGLPARLDATRTPCPHGCDRALDHAIMTAPDKRDPALLAKLDAVAGRLLAGLTS